MKNHYLIRLTKLSLFISLISTISIYGQKEIDFNSLEEYLGNAVRNTTLQNYCANSIKNPCFSYVYKVESGPGFYKLYGTGKDDTIYIAKINNVKATTVFKLSENSLNILKFKKFKSYLRDAFSLISVPIKVRPSFNGFDAKATSGLKNFGLNISLWSYESESFYANGKKSSWGFSGGYMIAPAVEEIKSSELEMDLLDDGESSKQFFISHGLTLTFRYNDIYFSYIPIGFDNGTTTLSKSWVFEDRRWWGIGLGVDIKALKPIFNK